MNYAPATTDQRGQLIMQGNEQSARMGQLALQYWQQMQQQDKADSQAKDSAIGQLMVMGKGDDTGGASGGFDPTSTNDPGAVMDNAELDGKKANTIRTLLGHYTDDTQAKTALKSKSLGELEGMLKGYATQSAMEEHSAKMQDFSAQAQLRKQQAQDDQSIGEAMTRYSTMPDVKTSDDEYQDTGMDSRPPTGDERFRYALKGVTGRAVPKLIDSLDHYNANQADAITSREEIYPGVTVLGTRKGGATVVENPAVKNAADLQDKFVQDPVSGARFHTFGKTSQPSGYDPDVSKTQLIPQLDADGTLVGWSSTDPRGHGTFVPNKGGSFKAARDEDGNILPGYYKDSQGKVLDVRTVLEKHLGKGGPTPATTAATKAPVTAGTLAMPKTKAEMQKGKVYATKASPTGKARWNGSNLIPE